MPSEALRDILEEIKSVEPLPRVVTRVMEISARPEVVPDELTEIIQTDPGLTAKVLKLCNSAYYGFQREIGSIQEAGNLLGVSTLTNLCLTSCASKYFRDYGRSDERSREGLWAGCVSNAVAAQMLADFHPGVDRARAYTAGLLLNLGLIVLDRYLDDHERDLASALSAGHDLLEAERLVFGLHHAEIGARLATRWGFPEVLIETIRHHHDPLGASIDPMMTWVCHIADNLTDSLSEEAGRHHALRTGALEASGIEAASIAELGDAVQRELERARAFVQAA